ncbi:MAG TPA: hypothetical protein VG320_28955 [Paraburkholderia sp.]|uniref:hypothetical protein n=1 Tax=Paraburkholderia sp. TaxID=1926495 RepID=UPI002DEF3102|nr:hypothetical protein [Paraburkholderia sp.]
MATGANVGKWARVINGLNAKGIVEIPEQSALKREGKEKRAPASPCAARDSAGPELRNSAKKLKKNFVGF